MSDRKKMKCFVAMPFEGFDDLYDKAILPVVEGCYGVGACSRGDTTKAAEVVSDRIVEEIIWASEIEQGEKKIAHPWQERTFDVRIGDRAIIDSLIDTFRDRWNRGNRGREREDGSGRKGTS